MNDSSGNLKLQERSREAYVHSLHAIRSLPECEFKHITIDVSAAVEVALSVAARVRTVFELLSYDTPGVDPTLPNRVESLSLALSHAHMLYQTAIEPPSPSEDLLNRAIKLREILLADINLLVLRGRVDCSVLAGLRGVNGYRNLAADLRMLIAVFGDSKDMIAGRTTVVDAELDEAEYLAGSIIAALAERERAPAFLAQSIRDRNAAYALFVSAYDDLRAAVRYLRRKQGDADLLAPTLFARRSLSKRSPGAIRRAPGVRTIANAGLSYSSGTST